MYPVENNIHGMQNHVQDTGNRDSPTRVASSGSDTESSSSAVAAVATSTTTTNNNNNNNKVTSTLRHSSTRKEQLQQSFHVYLAIEMVWHVSLLAACYRYRPLVKLSQTGTGQKFLQCLYRISGSSSSSITKTTPPPPWWQRMQHRVDTIPFFPQNNKQRILVACSEWFLFNKVLGIPLWPSKLLLAAWLYTSWEHYRYGTTTTMDTTTTTSSSSTTTPPKQ